VKLIRQVKVLVNDVPNAERHFAERLKNVKQLFLQLFFALVRLRANYLFFSEDAFSVLLATSRTTSDDFKITAESAETAEQNRFSLSLRAPRSLRLYASRASPRIRASK
jgi:hypothetical protein